MDQTLGWEIIEPAQLNGPHQMFFNKKEVVLRFASKFWIWAHWRSLIYMCSGHRWIHRCAQRKNDFPPSEEDSRYWNVKITQNYLDKTAVSYHQASATHFHILSIEGHTPNGSFNEGWTSCYQKEYDSLLLWIYSTLWYCDECHTNVQDTIRHVRASLFEEDMTLQLKEYELFRISSITLSRHLPWMLQNLNIRDWHYMVGLCTPIT